MIGRAKKQATLSDKIAGILSTAPGSFDPEDDIYEETTAKVNIEDAQDESDNEEIGLSKFRKQTVDLLEDVDQRYVGKKGSRRSIKNSDDEWETEDEGLSTDEGEALDGIEGTQELATDEEDESESDYDGEELSEDNNELSDDNEASPEDDNNFKHMSETNVSNQVKKGNCVRNQLNIWENLLEIRIQLQKCLVQSNKLPQHDVYKNFETEEFKSASKKTKRNMKNVLDKFLTLQSLLIKQFSESKSLLKEDKKKADSDEEIPSDSEAEIQSEAESEEEIIPRKRQKISDLSQEIKTRHEKYSDYRNSVIQKWNDKTRLAIGKNNLGSNSIIQHINFLLEDKQKLVKRTQLKRSEYETIGKIIPESTSPTPPEEQPESSKSTEEHDTEIYDDDDFYHQLLRELIEFKSAGVTDPVQMSRQWIQLQNLRSKMKRKIDTKATKGRKIRYAVHSKLVNFMAPIDYSTWTEEAKNELYASLFGNNQPRTSAT